MTSDAKPDTWMPLVIGDYLKDTTRLTTEQHGAYLLLIMSYWVDGPPPNDDEELAAITGLERKAWLKNRPKLERFFRIEDGRWRHKRVDEELERWAQKKLVYAARAAAGGRAKAAKSTPQAQFKQGKTGEKSCLNPAPQPASTVVGALTGQPTHSGQNDFIGPKEVRQAFVEAKGDDWTRSYLDPCGWQDVPERALIPHNGVAGAKLIKEGRAVLAKLSLIVLGRAA